MSDVDNVSVEQATEAGVVNVSDVRLRYFTLRPLNVDGVMVPAGTEIHDAHTWQNILSWVDSGKVLAIPSLAESSFDPTPLLERLSVLEGKIKVLEASAHTHQQPQQKAANKTGGR